MTRSELVERLEGKWRASLRQMGEVWHGIAFFTRDANPDDADVVEGLAANRSERVVAVCEIIDSPKPWAKLAYEGVTVRPDAWRVARNLNKLSGLPLIVVVKAADGARFLKVTDFGPDHLEAKRLPVPDFRPA